MIHPNYYVERVLSAGHVEPFENNRLRSTASAAQREHVQLSIQFIQLIFALYLSLPWAAANESDRKSSGC